ncbi:MAG: response regulator [Thaumarchaeota archaeon]|nr:response regulator [Nitrososphaerota archaeon]
MPNKKNSILIIEDSLAISMLIHEFLKKLDYHDVHTCNTGKAGIQSFSDLVNKGIVPVVFLDYHLPDMTANEIMSNILSIRPDTRIIIETADAKNEEQIKAALRDGAYQYVEKPIRYENLKNVIKTLEEEEPDIEKQTFDHGQKIESFLKMSTRISVMRLSEYSDTKVEVVKEYVKKLESEGRIQRIEDIKEITCNQCNSMRIAMNFYCPSCKSSNFKQGKLIEHFKCGNVSIDESYTNNTCPKCRKEIKILGVDYKAIDNYYICNDCGDKFPEPAHDYICVKCNNRFALDKAKWITSEGLKLVR